MAGLSPLSPLAGFTDATPEAPPENLHGGTYDPRHMLVPADPQLGAIYEEINGEPRPAFGYEPGLFGMDIVSMSDGADRLADDPTADRQPVTHGAAWPKGTPTTTTDADLADRHAQSAAIHGVDFGGSNENNYVPTLTPKNASWYENVETEPGTSLQVPIPDQVKTGAGGFASRDRVQSNALQNQYGFDGAHMRSRYAQNGLIGNNMWMDPAGRPMRKTVAGPAMVPVGADTPFAGQVPGEVFNSYGAVLEDLPVAYGGVPQVETAASYASSGDAAVVDFW